VNVATGEARRQRIAKAVDNHRDFRHGRRASGPWLGSSRFLGPGAVPVRPSMGLDHRIFVISFFASLLASPVTFMRMTRNLRRRSAIAFTILGGTRMATSEKSGVVDPDLRLFGTNNAYVCSTSVYPSAGFANPTHTLIALALRQADHLQHGIV
jgi:choline dehydrogenase-like flavoprotein